ncbi:hypothetical protein JTE90_021018 [Oedothorax gibbosus]|uniref:Uncharacterized protein n=1 Tax=Oedothorax gibbosus TaxID=931172 RepID=A0AAV6TFK5_9ARAC|nr:hypothetical protein JTE90_021018 [Oedothorax gibbosus]
MLRPIRGTYLPPGIECPSRNLPLKKKDFVEDRKKILSRVNLIFNLLSEQTRNSFGARRIRRAEPFVQSFDTVGHRPH